MRYYLLYNQPPDAPRGSNNQQCFLAVLRLQRVLARGDRALTVAKQENLGGVRDALIELLREDLVAHILLLLLLLENAHGMKQEHQRATQHHDRREQTSDQTEKNKRHRRGSTSPTPHCLMESCSSLRSISS